VVDIEGTIRVNPFFKPDSVPQPTHASDSNAPDHPSKLEVMVGSNVRSLAPVVKVPWLIAFEACVSRQEPGDRSGDQKARTKEPGS
jgi:hypothetical protein